MSHTDGGHHKTAPPTAPAAPGGAPSHHPQSGLLPHPPTGPAPSMAVAPATPPLAAPPAAAGHVAMEQESSAESATTVSSAQGSTVALASTPCPGARGPAGPVPAAAGLLATPSPGAGGSVDGSGSGGGGGGMDVDSAGGGSDEEERGEEGEEEEDEDDFDDRACEKCGDFGLVQFCDNCNGAWHTGCLEPPLKRTPDEFWLCPNCVGMCSKCISPDKRGADVRCRHCYRLYHSTCLDRVPKVDDVRWVCMECMDREKIDTILYMSKYRPLPEEERLKRVNAYRARDGLPPLDALKPLPPPTEDSMEYLVRFKGKLRAYWHCCWVSQDYLEKRSRSKRKNYHRNFGEEPNAPPDMTDRQLLENLVPNCFNVHRVIAKEPMCMDGHTDDAKYLVKFVCQGDYRDCSWEQASALAEWQGAIRDFENREKHGARREMLYTLEPFPEDKDVAVDPPKKPTHFVAIKEQPWKLKGGNMHDYQLEGLNWLRGRWWKKTSVILADEMGLGKTIQTIAFLTSVILERPADQQRPSLVLAPLSTLANWEREFETWAPHLNVVVFGGPKDSRAIFNKYETAHVPEVTFEQIRLQREAEARREAKSKKRGKGSQDGASDESSDDDDDDDDVGRLHSVAAPWLLK